MRVILVEDDPRCGRPSTSRNETNAELVKKMVREYCRLNMRLISDEFELKRYSVWQIITKDLGMCKVEQRWFNTWDHPQHSHVLFLNYFCQRKKLLNETMSALCRLVEAYREHLEEDFPKQTRNLRLVVWSVVITKSSSTNIIFLKRQ